MTADLSGRDLDEACARAMGWTYGAPWWARGHGEFQILPPRYSTDPTTDAEKLAWLRQRRYLVALFDFGERSCWVAYTWQGPRFDDYYRANGTTISEALSRLIVRVAEAKKESKP